MKKISLLSLLVLFCLVLNAQSPQKLSYQSIIRNSEGKLIQNSIVGIRLSILQGSQTGLSVYVETHNIPTNSNGLVSLYIGEGTTTYDFSSIDWAAGPYYLHTETDPTGGTNYLITGVSQLVSVPFALYAGNGFSGDYNDLTNKPVIDGSETKVNSGFNVSITGTGTPSNPYIVNAQNRTIVLTSSQTWTVPENVTKIKIELWGASGGGGGGSASYSYSLPINGGDGGCGGYTSTEMNVTSGQQFAVSIGLGGNAGQNETPYYQNDTNGGNGEDTWFENYRAAGGKGGKKGSYASYTVHGLAGTDNNGTIKAHSDPSNSNLLNVFSGVERSYIYPRVLTSKSGKGGSLITSYSILIPKAGESGCSILTLWE